LLTKFEARKRVDDAREILTPITAVVANFSITLIACEAYIHITVNYTGVAIREKFDMV